MIDDRGAFRLCYFQKDVEQWSFDNFGPQPSTNPLLGLTEEVGELSHAHLKGLQGIRHTPEQIQAMKKDAVGDIVVYLADYCAREGIDLESAVRVTWQKVRQRNWGAQPMTAADREVIGGKDQDHG